MKTTKTNKLVLSGLMLAIGLILPIVLHGVPNAGSTILPMHIPVILCGLICWWEYGLACGVILPLLSSIFTGMPPIFPVAVAMAFELGTYGLVSGLLRKKPIYLSLPSAMLAGRAVMGISYTVLLGTMHKSYAMPAFISGAFITALPGIIIQLALIPLIMLAIDKASTAKTK